MSPATPAAQQTTPLLGSAGARPVGFGPEPCEGTLVLASRALFEGIDTQRIWSCAARSSVSEAVGLLANLVQPDVGHGSALIVLRAR